jgi:hypothetical protein
MSEAKKEATGEKAEAKRKPDVEARLTSLEAQVRKLNAVMEQVYQKDFNKDGKIGRVSVGAVCCIAICGLIALAGPVLAREMGTAGWSNSVLGTAMFSTDDAGTATLQVDAVDTDSIDPGTLTSVESITFDDGQVIDTADTTNLTLTLPERALGRVTVVGGGTTNVAGDDVSLDVQGNDSATTNTTYLRINTDFTDVDPGTQDATVTLAIPVAGTLTTRATLNASGVTIAGTLAASNATVAGTLGVSGAVTFDNLKFNMSAIQDGTNGLAAGDLYYVSGDSNRVYVFQD